MKKMNPVVHFEMPMSNKERMSNFYKNAFGWDMQVMGEDRVRSRLAKAA
jgi:predicted enzyme related to lactoylglutathione lyase